MRDRGLETRGRQTEGQCTVDAQCKLGKNLHLGFAEYFLIFPAVPASCLSYFQGRHVLIILIYMLF